jgi:glycosyltransferase involved in cell wall biosynthesis
MVVNAGFPELDHFAAALCQRGMLSRYVRQYVNKGRPWEHLLAAAPGVGLLYGRTLGRRVLVPGLSPPLVSESALAWDFAEASASRLLSGRAASFAKKTLIAGRRSAIAAAGRRFLGNEKGIVASWGCAEPAFRRMKETGGACVLNYSFVHHQFTRSYLDEEAQLEPAFADTLTGHQRPASLIGQFDREIELADHILVGSSFARRTFIDAGVPKEKITAVAYGADTSLFEPDSLPPKRPDTFTVLFVGQLSQRKGLSYALRAYEKFRGAGTSLVLVGQVFGDGSALKPYQHLYQHIPHVPRAQLRAIYQQADVFLFPTLIEGMGMVVLEAMASGLPVITTPNGPGDVVRDGVDGFVVPPRDVDALAARLEQLRADAALRAQMARNACLRAQEFTWSAYRRNVLAAAESWL